MKHFTGTLRTLVFEILMCFTAMAASTVVKISCTHFFSPFLQGLILS